MDVLTILAYCIKVCSIPELILMNRVNTSNFLNLNRPLLQNHDEDVPVKFSNAP